MIDVVGIKMDEFEADEFAKIEVKLNIGGMI